MSRRTTRKPLLRSPAFPPNSQRQSLRIGARTDWKVWPTSWRSRQSTHKANRAGRPTQVQIQRFRTGQSPPNAPPPGGSGVQPSGPKLVSEDLLTEIAADLTA